MGWFASAWYKYAYTYTSTGRSSFILLFPHLFIEMTVTPPSSYFFFVCLFLFGIFSKVGNQIWATRIGVYRSEKQDESLADGRPNCSCLSSSPSSHNSYPTVGLFHLPSIGLPFRLQDFRWASFFPLSFSKLLFLLLCWELACRASKREEGPRPIAVQYFFWSALHIRERYCTVPYINLGSYRTVPTACEGSAPASSGSQHSMVGTGDSQTKESKENVLHQVFHIQTLSNADAWLIDFQGASTYCILYHFSYIYATIRT